MTTTKKQPIIPDFSGLIQAQAEKKIQPQPPAKTQPEQSPAKTKTQAKRNRPAWMRDTIPGTDPASLRERQNVKDSLTVAEAETITPDPTDMEILQPAETETTGSLALEPIDYPRGGEQTQPSLDDETELALIQDALDQGMTVPALCRKYNISKATVQRYIAKAREEMDINSQVMDIGLINKLEGASHQIAESLIKTKMDEVGFKDRGIVLGIILDKLKDLRGPRTGGNALHLRAVFRGEGAIEVHTGE